MDDTEEEKVQLLESIRLQDAALSATLDDTIATIDSESDDDVEEILPAVKLEIATNQSPFEADSVGPNQDVSSEPSWADALEANQEYDAVLAKLEGELKQNIVRIEKQLDEIQDRISTVNKEGRNVNMKSHWIYVFGMPYFKSSSFYPCPPNEDYLTKQRNNEVCWPDLPMFHQWVSRHKKMLNYAVRKLSLKKCENDARLKLAVLKKELETARENKSIDRTSQLEKEIESFDVRGEAESMVDDVVANGDHDWMQISAKYLQGTQTAETCRSFWYLYLHPKINKGPYTEEEEAKLIELVDKYNHQDWDNIADELGTNRSGYQCFIVYHNKLNITLKRNSWDAAEDKKLLQVIDKYRLGTFIPWGKVAYHMEGRTKTQVFNRWSYSLNPAIKKGRFTQEEDVMILVGVQMWGEDFQRISNFLKDRTTCQVRDRYRHYLSRPSKGTPWTIEDDELLLRLTEQHGKNWAKIAEHFPTKDRTQVRHRHTTLSKWRMKNPDAPLSDAPHRVYNPGVHKEFEEQWEKAKSILNCETVEEMVKAKNNLVSSLAKKKKSIAAATKRKPSVIETDLINYFRCSFDVPGGSKKARLFSGDAQKYADELPKLITLLNADLNLPSIEEVQQDTKLSSVDREILTTFLLRHSKNPEDNPPEFQLEEDAENPLFNDHKDLTSLFHDDEPSFSRPETPPNINYTSQHDINKLYIDLPLMNFDQDEVVADRNHDPSFFEPWQSRECSIFDVEVPTSKEKDFIMFPPNLSTLVGLRTFLLNRRNLLTWSNAEIMEPLDLVEETMLEEAKKKFDERILSLFLWPAMMSRSGPSSSASIFLDKEDEKALASGRNVTLGNRKKVSKKNVEAPTDSVSEQSQIVGSSVEGNIMELDGEATVCRPDNAGASGPLMEKETVVNAESHDDPSGSSTSGPPPKKRKSVVVIESSDDLGVPSTSKPFKKRKRVVVSESDDDLDELEAL